MGFWVSVNTVAANSSTNVRHHQSCSRVHATAGTHSDWAHSWAPPTPKKSLLHFRSSPRPAPSSSYRVRRPCERSCRAHRLCGAMTGGSAINDTDDDNDDIRVGHEMAPEPDSEPEPYPDPIPDPNPYPQPNPSLDPNPMPGHERLGPRSSHVRSERTNVSNR